MTQVTRFGGVIPVLTSGAVGYDPADVADGTDVPPPVDVALGTGGTVAEVPVAVGGSVALVQSKEGHNTDSASGITITFDSPPTEGNLLVAVIEKRGTPGMDTSLSGWTLLDDVATATPSNHMTAFWKVAGASESSAVAFSSGSGNYKRGVIAEFSGVGQLDVSDSNTDQSAATSHPTPSVTPTAGQAAVVLALFVKNDNDEHLLTTPSGYTALDGYSVAIGLGPQYQVAYKAVGSTTGSYSATSTETRSDTWGSIIAVFTPITGGFIWTLAPETIDADDATYDPTAVADADDSIWRIQLAGAKKISHVVARIGAAAGGAQSSDLYGATLPDFSDEVLLATRAWTATGSYTSDEFEMLPPGTTAYAYYRLTGPDDVRIYTVEMYPPATATTADLSGYQLTIEKDAPGGYAGLDGSGLVPVAELPFIEDLATGSTDTTKVYGPDGAGGVALVAMGAGSGLPWFNLMDPAYGALNDASTDDTSAINAAIAAINSAGYGVLYCPGGLGYKVSGALTALTFKGMLLGDGGSFVNPATKFIQTSSTTHTITLSQDGLSVRGIAGSRSGSASTAGSFIRATTGNRNHYEDLSAIGFWIGCDIDNAAEWAMSGCYWADAIKYNARVANAGIPDGGDWSISDTWFGKGSGSAADAHLRYDSGGGGKIVNCKFNGSPSLVALALDIAMANGIQTSVMTITGCSFENVSSHAIKITTAGTGTFGLIAISACEFGLYSNNSGRIIYVSAASAGTYPGSGRIGGISIDGLVARTDGTARAAIELINTDNVKLGQVALVGFNALYTSSGDTNTDISGASFATPSIVLGSSAAAGSASTVIRSDGTIAAFDATSPSTQALGDSAVVGTAAFAARRDHKHAMPALSSATPLVASGGGAVGTALPSSRQDHVHPTEGATGAAHYLTISSSHSTPLVFDDIVQSSAGDDFIYSS